MRFAHRSEAREQRIGEDDSVVSVEAEVVNVDITGKVRDLRNIDRVVAVPGRGALAGIDERGDLVHRRDDQPGAGNRHAHWSVESPFKDRQSRGLAVAADQEDLAALIGGEGEATATLRQPRNELTGCADLQPWRFG